MLYYDFNTGNYLNYNDTTNSYEFYAKPEVSVCVCASERASKRM